MKTIKYALGLALALPLTLHAETTLVVKTPPKPDTLTSDVYYAVKDTDIDARINKSIVVPAANSLFNNIQQLGTSLSTAIKTELWGDDNVLAIYYLNVDTTDIKATIQQEQTSISTALTGVDISTRVKYDVDGTKSIFCPSVTTTVNFKSLKISGSYNIYSGQLNADSADYTIDVASASCSGIIGFFVDTFLGGTVKGTVKSILKDKVSAYSQGGNIGNFFSVRELVNALLEYIPLVRSPDNALKGLDKLINNTNLNSGLQIEAALRRNHYGTNKHQIELIASHQAPRLMFEPSLDGSVMIDIAHKPARTEKVDLYYQSPYGSRWYRFGTLPNNGGRYQFASGTRLKAIAISNFIPGLISHSSNSIRFTVPDNCLPIGSCQINL